jgi:hypothetical protein
VRFNHHRRFWFGIVVALAVCACGCNSRGRSPNAEGDPRSNIRSQPLAARSHHNGTHLFESLSAAEIGIEFVHRWQPRDEYEAKLLKTGFTGGGVCLGDYDQDGLCDVFLTRPHGGGRLYRNLGGFQFRDVTEPAGVLFPDDWMTGSAFVDVNNDSLLDLFVCSYGTRNRLFINMGGGTFQDRSVDANVDFAGASVKAVFADYDNDGDLDAYLVTNRLEPRGDVDIRYLGTPGKYTVAPEHTELALVINLPTGEQKFTKAGQFDYLYRNNLKETGQLTFTDVTKEAGISGNYHGLDVTWWDSDNDGDADLYVANDFTDPDQFFRNNGDGTFTDVTNEALPNTPWFTMGAAFGDINNDTRFDLLATDMSGTTHYREKMAMGSMDTVSWFLDTAEPRQYMRNAMFLNTGTPRFMDVAHMSGLASSDWTWSVKLADLDNDGWEDVFITNGFTRDYLNSDFNERLSKQGQQANSMAWYEAPELKERNLAFRNMQDLRYQPQAADWGVDEFGITFGAALGDLDNDGDLDLITNNFDGPPSVYRNQSTSNHVLKVALRGRSSNSHGFGARVEARCGKQTFARYHNPGNGFMSSNDPVVYFGLGTADRVDQLTIRWPSGIEQTITQLAADHQYKITESGVDAPAAGSSTSIPLYARSDMLQSIVHRERFFDDFARQPLLPNKMSQLGPGMAVGDVDRDGDEDLFLGGAAGQSGQLYLHTDDRFKPVEVPALHEHRFAEDMGCLLVDIDADGDLDLFVVSGGVECDAGDAILCDRIYRNVTDPQTKQIAFEYVPDLLPADRDSGGPVSAADFDRDGDVDLFVGGRVLPHEYPQSPVSRLLRNDGGTFVDVTADCAAELARAGMVTSSTWSDVNNDGWIDLLLTLEYGPIKVYHNVSGKLVDQTVAAGTSELHGWWNSIAGRDVDHDGDMDFAVGNLGLNTKYHPSPQKPQYIFYGDFDQSGHPQIVEAKPGDQGLLPVRGRSCSSNAMPFLKTKFKTYHDFASASLSEIYTDECLEKSVRLEAHVASSGILLNDGQGRFTFQEFPRQAQVAPIFGLRFVDVNDDPHPDLFVAHNFFSPQRETGRMNAGIGCVLVGDGTGRFRCVDASDSGIVIPRDAKSVVAMDLDRDQVLDFVVGVNDGPIQTLLGRSVPKTLTIPLVSSDATQTAIGARTTVRRKSGRVETFESYCGAGYLSQSSSQIELRCDDDDPPVMIQVRWSNGTTSELPLGK